MFKDHAVIYVRAGKGGDGCVAFRREKFVDMGGPAGGDGGNGGSVYLFATLHENTLLSLVRNPHVRAKAGEPGQGRNMAGAAAEDVMVPVPIGTLVFDFDTGALLRDLKAPGDRVCVAKGGNGGFGNKHFTTSVNQAPRFARQGLPGESRTVRLELRLIADVGLIGFPNAGKSTLISCCSAATPKVADYPFTTLQPHPGIVELSDDRRFVMVDIPGLIEGASDGKGLGHRFLKHVERTRLLVHLVDMAPSEGRDPVADYRVILKELENYSPALAAKPRLTVLSKADLVPDPDAHARAFAAATGEPDVLVISAVTRRGVAALLEECWRRIDALEKPGVAASD